MDIDDLPFWQKCLIHWTICAFLIWVGWNNEDAYLFIMIIGWATFLYIFKDI